MNCLCGEKMRTVIQEKEGKILGCESCLRVAVVAEDFTTWYSLEKVERTKEEVKQKKE